MTGQIQPGAQLYSAGFGIHAENVEVPHIDVRAPTTSDIGFPVGKIWIDSVALNSYQLVGFTSFNGLTTATWNVLGGTASVESVVGTANQVAVSTAAGIATVSLPAVITAPGSLATTTTLASGTTLTSGTSLAVTTTAVIGTGLTVSAGGAAITGTTGINVSGAAVTTIGTGGTGPVAIGNATGNTAVTGNLTASTGLIATTGGVTASAGGASITGTTNINTSGASISTIGTGGTGAVNIGNATGGTAVTGPLSTTSFLKTQPSNSNTVTAAFVSTLTANTPVQNTNAYNLLCNIGFVLTAATAGTIVLGVSASATPTTNTVISSFTIAAQEVLTISAYVPAGYYLVYNTTGAVTVAAVSVQSMGV